MTALLGIVFFVGLDAAFSMLNRRSTALGFLGLLVLIATLIFVPPIIYGVWTRPEVEPKKGESK